jgi:DHA1 family multidrug resistance protein-like MFS transporter
MLLARIVPKERIGFALGWLNTAIYVGNLVGPVGGGVAVATVGLRGSFLAGAALIGLCTIATVALVHDAPPVARSSAGGGLRAGARDMIAPFRWPSLRGVLVVGLLMQIVSASTYAFIAIYALQLARPSWLSVELVIGLSLAASALAAAIATPMLGAYADGHDARAVLVVSLAVVGLALVPQALVQSAVVFVLFRLMIGIGLAGTTVSIAVLTRAAVETGAEGRGFGALATAQNLGWGFGPIVGAGLAAVAGIPALFLASAVVTLGLVPLALAGTRSPATVEQAVGQWS